MQEDFEVSGRGRFENVVKAEISYIRRLGSIDNLILATGNLGAYEALLTIIDAGDSGIPVYHALKSVKSRYSSQAGILGRLKVLRQVGLIEERAGSKRSQVCLIPSEKLMRDLGPILEERLPRV